MPDNRDKPEGFREDLVIADTNGDLYYLDESQWRNDKYRVKDADPKRQRIVDLLQQGSLIATFDRDVEPVPQADMFCYLLNLAALNPSTIWSVKKPPAK